MSKYLVKSKEVRIATTSPIPLLAVVVLLQGSVAYVIDINHLEFKQGYIHPTHRLGKINTLSFYRRTVWINEDADMNTVVYFLDSKYFEKELIVDE